MNVSVEPETEHAPLALKETARPELADADSPIAAPPRVTGEAGAVKVIVWVAWIIVSVPVPLAALWFPSPLYTAVMVSLVGAKPWNPGKLATPEDKPMLAETPVPENVTDPVAPLLTVAVQVATVAPLEEKVAGLGKQDTATVGVALTILNVVVVLTVL
jgi:hypothetical protein